MVTLNISLPDQMKNFVDEEVAQHGYASADDYFRALLHQEQKRRAKRDLEAKLLEGLKGPMVTMDRAEWGSIRQEALEGSAAREMNR